MRPDYCLVNYQIANKFVASLKTAIDHMYGKDTKALGKVINDFHTKRCCNLLADHQGTVVVGNENAHNDLNLTPTVVLNPSEDCELMKHETFGPILNVFTYKKFDDAVKFINARPKPLAVYYFGNNSSGNQNMQRLISETSSGAFACNEITLQMLNSELPFGGVGQSGYGRLKGKAGFDQCSNKKSILHKTPLTFYPFTVIFPPFTADK